MRTLGVLSVLLFAMVLRGMVPAGYMPNSAAGLEGESLFAFCTPQAHGKTPAALLALWADVDIAANADTGPDTRAMEASCAFCVLGQLDMGLPEIGVLSVASVRFFSHPVIALRNFSLPPSGVRGPPLGSRAPPFFIV